jgi:protocatechuate 3,4-dioxygenase beta subunit
MALRHAFAVALLVMPIGAEARTTRGQIAGRTIDETGAPIPGAFVTVRPSKPAAGHVELEVLSDESGRFRFDDIPPGPYRVAAHLFGFHLATSNVEAPVARGADVSLVMTVAPIVECVKSFLPTVEFRTRSGDQLPTAYLTVTRDGGRTRSYEVLPMGRPDPCFSPEAQDHVSLDVLGYGEHVLKRAGQDPAMLTSQVAIDPTVASRTGRTRPGQAQGQVRGRVFDVYGASIPDASVLFQPVDPRSGLTAFGAVADARGRFDFEGVRTGTYRVTCRARGYETSVAVHEVRPGVQNEVTLIVRAVK